MQTRPRDSRIRLVFLLLILAQVAHSIEEYCTRLFDVFALTRFVSGLFSSNLAVGFAIANVGLVGFGLWCWAVPVRSGWRVAPGLIWFWTILELLNGSAHGILALLQKGYFPGLATAPLLLLFAGWLATLQLKAR